MICSTHQARRYVGRTKLAAAYRSISDSYHISEALRFTLFIQSRGKYQFYA